MYVYLVFENWAHDSNLLITPPTTNLEKALAVAAKGAEAYKWERVPDETLINHGADGGRHVLVAMWLNFDKTSGMTVEKWLVED